MTETVYVLKAVSQVEVHIGSYTCRQLKTLMCKFLSLEIYWQCIVMKGVSPQVGTKACLGFLMHRIVIAIENT